ncbi:MAG: protein arginine kinase [Clostridiales bacterium]|nr:protein arginine kinase [Clostridiales bacterium]
MSKWYIEDGPESDVVISTRIRSARNLKEYPFPVKMGKEQSEQVINLAYRTLGKEVEGTNFDFCNVTNISTIDKEALVEKHLISPNMLDSKVQNGVFLGDDEKISIMVNEEDHFRIQSMDAGFRIENCLSNLNRIEEYLESKLEFAFSPRYGYLTSCPTNLGTGIRVSVMMHLPALVMTEYIDKIIAGCSKVDFTVRGIYGENTSNIGNIFQISNQVTLGVTVDEIVGNTISVAKQVISYERNLRKELYASKSVELEDRIYRAYGIFTNARKISTEEGLKIVSDIRLGIDLGLINNIDKRLLNEIALNIKPANLQKVLGKELEYNKRDEMRANYIRQKINK